tara:strand:+ start:894 stop:1700 length:807 start_codon:yes stop_codon:yes gene_type:complete
MNPRRIRQLERACIDNYLLQKDGKPIQELSLIDRAKLEETGFYFNQSAELPKNYLLARIIDKGRKINREQLEYKWYIVERETQSFEGVSSYDEWALKGGIKDEFWRFGKECVLDITYERDFWGKMYPGIPNLKSFFNTNSPDEQNIHLFLQGLFALQHHKNATTKEDFVNRITGEVARFYLFNYLPNLLGISTPTKEQEAESFFHSLESVPSQLALANTRVMSKVKPEDYGSIVWQELKKRATIEEIAKMTSHELSQLARQILLDFSG